MNGFELCVCVYSVSIIGIRIYVPVFEIQTSDHLDSIACVCGLFISRSIR